MLLYGLLTRVCSRKRARRDGAATWIVSAVAGWLAVATEPVAAFSSEVEVFGPSAVRSTAVSVTESGENGRCSGFGEDVIVEVEWESFRV